MSAPFAKKTSSEAPVPLFFSHDTNVIAANAAQKAAAENILEIFINSVFCTGHPRHVHPDKVTLSANIAKEYGI